MEGDEQKPTLNTFPIFLFLYHLLLLFSSREVVGWFSGGVRHENSIFQCLQSIVLDFHHLILSFLCEWFGRLTKMKHIAVLPDPGRPRLPQVPSLSAEAECAIRSEIGCRMRRAKRSVSTQS